MNRTACPAIITILVLLAVFSGCTGNQPAPQPIITPVPATAALTLTPVSTPVPYPDALSAGEPLAFGSGTKTGEITVSGYTVRPSYTWVDPSWNSPREQSASSPALETQKGYNTKKPQDGNTFLFVFLNVTATGPESVYAPSPGNIVVVSEGKTYSYSTLASSQTVVDGETGKQYDFLIGTGGTGGFVDPGKSNTVRGFLIYEIPASFSPGKTYVVSSAGAGTQGAWKLA